jgi:hypothetical protein
MHIDTPDQVERRHQQHAANTDRADQYTNNETD